MNPVENIIHFMVPATQGDQGLITGEPVQGTAVRMPPEMRAALAGKRGVKWKPCCGKLIGENSIDGMTLHAPVVNCPDCKGREEYAESMKSHGGRS